MAKKQAQSDEKDASTESETVAEEAASAPAEPTPADLFEAKIRSRGVKHAVFGIWTTEPLKYEVTVTGPGGAVRGHGDSFCGALDAVLDEMPVAR